MDHGTYTQYSGVPVDSSNQTRIDAAIKRTQLVLESLLGYTLSTLTADRNENQAPAITPAPVDAYRVYPYIRSDKNKLIDPCLTIHSIRVLKNGEVIDVLEADEYSVIVKKGIIRYFMLHNFPCGCQAVCMCNNPQYEFAVDANWCFETVPDDILSIWADMITAYSDPKAGVKSETLGPHSYTMFDGEAAENDPVNRATLTKYAGPAGQLIRNNTY